jgi:hypothetical protein
LTPATRIRRPARAAVAIVSLAVLFGGIPLTLGVVVHSSEAMFTLDICHPVHSFSHSPVAVVAIIPDSPTCAECLPEWGRFALPSATVSARPADAPTRRLPKRALRRESGIYVCEGASRRRRATLTRAWPRATLRRPCARPGRLA